MAAGIVLVYDVTDPKSYENISYWLGKIQANGELDTEIVLLGNKIDLINDIQVDQTEANKLATENNITHIIMVRNITIVWNGEVTDGVLQRLIMECSFMDTGDTAMKIAKVKLRVNQKLSLINCKL